MILLGGHARPHKHASEDKTYNFVHTRAMTTVMAGITTLLRLLDVIAGTKTLLCLHRRRPATINVFVGLIRAMHRHPTGIRSEWLET